MNKPERIFFDGKSYFDALIADIGLARESIDFETYIFDLDDVGHRILAALEDAARRGVRVRLLVDGFGAIRSIRRLAERLVQTPVQFRVYRPISLDETLLTRKTFRYVSRRNHRKTCLIDGHTAWIGSFNVSEVHARKTGTTLPWRDTAIRVHEQGHPDLLDAFERAWNGNGSSRLARPRVRRSRFLLNCTARLRERRNRDLTAHIRKARSRVWITTPYFTPDHKIMKALKDSASAGADVRLLLPEKPDVPGMGWINSAFYKRLFRNGLRIFLYRSSVLHAKTILADNWAIVGSSNLNHRSLFQDLEVDAVVTSPESLKALDEQFRRDLLSAKEVVSDESDSETLLTKAFDRMALFIREWT